jgi:hypothetical protein
MHYCTFILMKQYIIIILSFIIVSGCKKEKKPRSFPDKLFITFTIENQTYSAEVPDGEFHYGTGHNSEVEPGNFVLARGAAFDISAKSSIDFQLASARGKLITDRPATFESLKYLFAPGEKKYDSIAFAWPQHDRKVEIAYKDEEGTIWYTTKLTYIHANRVDKVVDQPGGVFLITEMKEVPSGNNGENGLVVKGSFNCILYEFDGPGMKQLTNGRFAAYIGL